MSDVDEAFARSGCAVPGDAKLNAHNRRVWRDAWAAGEVERLRQRVKDMEDGTTTCNKRIAELEHEHTLLHWMLTKTFVYPDYARLPDGWFFEVMDYLKGSLETPGPTESQGSIEARRLINAECRAEPPVDPMDWPLPCDVTIGHGTIKRGSRLSTLVAQMAVLYELAHGEDVVMSIGDVETE